MLLSAGCANDKKSITLSSTESEFVSFSTAAREISWCRDILQELGFEQKGATILQCDNSGASDWSEGEKSGYFRKTKYLDMRHLYVRGLVSDGIVKMERVSTKDQLSDCLTKPLPAPAIQISNDRFNLKERKILENYIHNDGREDEM